MEIETNSNFGASRANYESIFRGVVAYVDVWSGNENRCECVKAELKVLGAVVQDKFSTNVSHVLFNEGTLATYKKARTRKVPLVSVMWIEESKRILKKACEKAFCALHLDRYEARDLFSPTNPCKRLRRVGGYRRIRKKKKASPSDEENSSLETYFNPALFNENASLLKDGIISTLEHVAGEAFSVPAEEDVLPCSQFTAEINEPLTKKLYNRFFSELKKIEGNEDESKILNNSKSEVSGAGQINPLIVSRMSEKVAPMEVNDSLNCCDKKAQLPITFFFQSAKITTRLPAIVMSGMLFEKTLKPADSEQSRIIANHAFLCLSCGKLASYLPKNSHADLSAKIDPNVLNAFAMFADDLSIVRRECG